jgi:hypothetical protein
MGTGLTSNVKQHATAYHEKLAMPELDSIATHFPGGRWANRLSSVLFNLMSLMIWFTIFLALGWLLALALYQDARGVPGLFFANKSITPGWFYFHVLLCSPIMLVAKLVSGVSFGIPIRTHTNHALADPRRD